jgi:uncharacterized protein
MWHNETAHRERLYQYVMTPIISDLETIRHMARERRDEFEIMRYMLEANDTVGDSELDQLVDEIAAPVIAAIDCTRCGNCCRSLDVYLTEADAERLADCIDVPVSEVHTRYIDLKRAAEVEEWGVFNARPCTFLRGMLCSVYERRPDTCRTYPQFTPDFRWVLGDMLEGAVLCPIIYNVLDRMLPVTEALSRQSTDAPSTGP